MDPALHELIGTGQPSDEVAVLLRLAHGTAPEGARIVAQFGEIATARLDRSAIRRVHNTGGVKSVKAPHLYGPDWIAATEETDSIDIHPTDERRPSGIKQTGRGIVVALIDWGLDFAHPDFRNRDGSSRVLALWDQRIRTGSRSNNRYGYGWVHDRAAINQALRQRDPYSVLAYHPADAGRGPTHGTHTAGIVAGNGAAGGPAGMAPESSIVFVHLATATGERGDNLGDSVALLEAIDFIARVAGKRPWVLSLSMGRHAGPHDGCTLTEQGMDAALSMAPGRACVQSTGNYFSRPIHTQGILRPGEVRDIGFHTGEEDGFSHEIDIWYSGRDRITVEVVTPSQKSAGRAETGAMSRLTDNGKNIGRVYNRRHDPNNHDNQAHIYLDDAAPRGAWILRLYGADVVDGRYHCWIERDPSCSSCQPRFDPGDAISATTTGTICNGFLTVAVGAYDAHKPDRPIAPFSSAGPTRDGRFKPDIVAPGVQVLSARSAPRELSPDHPKLARMSGTSMASPCVAGLVALMFEASGRPLPVRHMREMLLKAAEPVSGEAQSRWGSGYMNVVEAIAAAAEARHETIYQDNNKAFSNHESVADAIRENEQESASSETTSRVEAGEYMQTETSGAIDARPSQAPLSQDRDAQVKPTQAGDVRETNPGVFRLEEVITFDAAKSFVFPRFRSVIEAAFACCTDQSASRRTKILDDRAILVAGHSDADEFGGRNHSLSRRRADAVVSILTLNPDAWEQIAIDECWWDNNSELEVMLSTLCGHSHEVSSAKDYRRSPLLRRRLIRRYLKSLRPPWLCADPLCHPGLVAVVGSSGGAIGCGQTQLISSWNGGRNRRAEIYFFPGRQPVLHNCNAYRTWQRLDTGLIEPHIELRKDSDGPYEGPFHITLPTGETLHESTDGEGRWRRPGLPAGRYTLTVPAHNLNSLDR